MVLRRITTSLNQVTQSVKRQNWTAIGIEFVLVVVGVFLGIAAANWNQERLEKRETRELLAQLDTELTDWVAYIDSVKQYYASASGYADRATAGWKRDPSVSDEQFVIAAYQSTQITSIGNNAAVWSTIFGAENLRDIDDPDIRDNLAAIMTFDYAPVNLQSVSSRYREEVRKTVPDSLQSRIRAACGDRVMRGGALILPARCSISLPAAEVAAAAAALRARPNLVGELYWHRAAVANQLAQADIVRQIAANLTASIAS